MPILEEYNALTYNSQPFEQSVGIFRVGEQIAQIQKNIKYDITLDNKSIQKIQLISEIYYPILTGEIVYIDKSLDKLPNVVVDGHSFLNIALTRLDTENVKQESFVHTFVIENIELLDINENVFKITFKSIYWFVFNNYTLYSSIDEEKPYTKILFEILNLNSKFLAVDNLYRETSSTGDFMTRSNMTLFDSVYDLLDSCLDIDNGFYFLQYDFSNNTYFIRDIKSQYKNLESAAKRYNAFILKSDKNSSDSRVFEARDVTFTNQLSIEEYIEYIKGYTIWNFDYDTREFVSNTVNLEKIKKYFPKETNNKFTINLKDVPNAIPNDIRRTTAERRYKEFVGDEKYNALFMLTNTIEFTCDGRLDRIAGDIVGIDVSNTDSYKHKFQGYWLSGKIYHEFSNGKYENIIMASRLENLVKMEQNRGK